MTLRPGKRGAEEIVLGEWTGAEAARNHNQTAQLLPAYGVTDLVGAWEEIQFEMYRIFLNSHPQLLVKDEYKILRPIYYARRKDLNSEEAWQTAWKERLDGWQRRRLYGGLGKIFVAYMQHTKLKRPSFYHRATVDDWALVIDAFVELRNLITHGAGIVSDKLASLTGQRASAGFDFTAGEQLHVTSRHMQLVECFFNQLLTALNTSLIEKVRGPLQRFRPVAKR
jgi:hypothetical protein